MHATVIFNVSFQLWQNQSPANSFQINIDKVEWIIWMQILLAKQYIFQIIWRRKMKMLWVHGWEHWYAKSVTKMFRLSPQKRTSGKTWVSEKKLLKDIFEQLSTETTHTDSFKRWLVQVREVWKLFHWSNLPAKPQEPLRIVWGERHQSEVE